MLYYQYFFYFSSFKLFLELEPQLRDIIHKFYESSYAQCLRLLTEIKVRRNGVIRNFLIIFYASCMLVCFII